MMEGGILAGIKSEPVSPVRDLRDFHGDGGMGGRGGGGGNGGGGGAGGGSDGFPPHLMLMRPASVGGGGHGGGGLSFMGGHHGSLGDHPSPVGGLSGPLPPNSLLPLMALRSDPGPDAGMAGPKRSRLVPEVWTHC